MNEVSLAGAVQRFEPLGRRSGASHGEFTEGIHRDRGRWTFEDARSLRRHCHGAERRRLTEHSLFTYSCQREMTGQSSVAWGLPVRWTWLHVALRVEVRMCRT